MSERVTSEMLEAATEVAAWRGDGWINADFLPAIYLAMRECDPAFPQPSDVELECALQEAAFVHGAQSFREMIARFVENGPPTDAKALAGSIRANWVPGWGTDPGPLPGSIPYNAFGETAETDRLLATLAAGSGTAKTAKPVECEASQSGPQGNAQKDQSND